MATFTYDLDTQVGKLRFMIGDADISSPTGDDRSKWSCQFTDEELEYILSVEDTLNQAAGAALETIASSEARLAIQETLGDKTINTTQLSKQLREQAKMFRDRDMSEPYFDVAEVPCDDFSYRETLIED